MKFVRVSVTSNFTDFDDESIRSIAPGSVGNVVAAEVPGVDPSEVAPGVVVAAEGSVENARLANSKSSLLPLHFSIIGVLFWILVFGPDAYRGTIGGIHRETPGEVPEVAEEAPEAVEEAQEAADEVQEVAEEEAPAEEEDDKDLFGSDDEGEKS